MQSVGQTVSSADQARARADVGIMRVTLATERTPPGWVAQAVELIRGLSRVDGLDVFTVEVLRCAIASSLPDPSDQRIWGAVTRAAVRAGVIERTGQFAGAYSSNGSPKPLYRLCRPCMTDGGLSRG